MKLKNGLLGTLALVTCPCHLPLLLAVAAGTSAGAWLSRYQGPVVGVMAALFMLSLYLLYRRMSEGGAKR